MAKRPRRAATRFHTASELSQLLKVSPRTILAWHRRGLIPGVQPTGSTVRFIADDVVAALKGSRR
jgi:excisionase family DNA binding protein